MFFIIFELFHMSDWNDKFAEKQNNYKVVVYYFFNVFGCY